MARKFNKNKRHRTDDYNHDAGHAMSGNGLESAAGPGGIIPNGFTIDFDDFQDGIRPKNRYAGKGEDDVEDSTQQAPRGGLGSQVLPCALELPGDHSGEPLDGHEYLYFVRWVYIVPALFYDQNSLMPTSPSCMTYNPNSQPADVRLRNILASKRQKHS